MQAPLLELDRLSVRYPIRGGRGQVCAVQEVSLALAHGETLGLVGESGCGKSTVARAIVGLVPAAAGAIRVDGRDLAVLSKKEMRAVRPRIQLIFQDPYASLDPRQTVFDAIAEPMRAHHLVSRAGIPGEVAKLMDNVGLARRFIRKYPHEFSGGQRQRIAIARALALRPELLVADEPVSALDVSVQAQILNLLADLREAYGLSMMLISHDLAVVHHMSERIAVMYLGRIVETGPAGQLFASPLHPYTQTLLNAIPTIETAASRDRTAVIPKGEPPSPLNPPGGCAFHPRCPKAAPQCARTRPELQTYREHSQAACWYPAGQQPE